MKRLILLLGIVGLNAIATLTLFAAAPPPPILEQPTVNGAERNLRFIPYPGAQSYTFYSGARPFSNGH